MSFLYTLVFAGFMLASNGSLHNPNQNKYIAPENKIARRADETERFAQNYPLNADGKVSVSNVNGSITIETWDQPEVRFEYVKSGKTKESLAEVEVRIDARQDAFSVETDYGDRKQRKSGYGSNLEIEYRLTVPRRAVLDEIETVNGSVSITNAENTTKASAVNGEVKGINLRGAANLSTVNGTVTAVFDQLATGSRINLETVNGSVNLMIPSDANATLKAETVNGKISNDFNLPVRKGQYVGSDLYGRLGGGEISIKMESVNGSLSVRHQNDGKTLSAATNLLSAKNKNSDGDEDFSGVTPPNPPNPPNPPLPPLPPHRLEIEQSLKDAQKEINQMSPEMRKEIEKQLKLANVNLNAVTQKEIQKALEQAGKEISRMSPEVRAQFNAAIEQSKQAMLQYQQAMRQTANANFNNGSPAIEEKTGVLTVKGAPQIVVDAGDSTVAVRGWDKPEIRYTLTRIARGGSRTAIDLQVEQNNSNVGFKVGGADSGDDYSDDSSRLRLEIFVPRQSNLKVVTGGEIRLENVSGKIDLQGDDEAIDVRDSDGELSLASDDARIRVIGFKGALTAKNEDGTMNFEGDFRDFSAETVDGTIILTLPENVRANIESNSKNTVGEGFTPIYTGDRQNGFVWKIGGGGSVHRLSATEDGKIIVRNANALQSAP